MTNFKTEHVKVAAIATTVPPVSGQVDFEGVGKVTIRHCLSDQTTSDLGYDAARRIIAHYDISLEVIGVLIFLSRTPDYRSPTTAAVLQGRLGLSTDCICYDVNAGTNGLALGITLVSSILQGANSDYGLIVIGDTPSKLYNPDTAWSAIESDAASAILLKKGQSSSVITSITKSFGHLFDDFSVLKGGFRYYDRNKPFNATDKHNFKVSFDAESVAQFLSKEFVGFYEAAKPENAAVEITLWDGGLSIYGDLHAPTDTRFHSPLAALQAYGHTHASSIPLQLSLLKQQQDAPASPSRLNLFAIGEGLSLWFLSFDIDFADVLATEENSEIFPDFEITHEM